MDEIRAICRANEARLESLAIEIGASATAETLTDQGAIVAQLAGVVAGEVQQIRPIDLADVPAPEDDVREWLAELDDLVAAGTDAVDASAHRSLDSFTAAAGRVDGHLRRAARLARQLDLDACATDVP